MSNCLSDVLKLAFCSSFLGKYLQSWRSYRHHMSAICSQCRSNVCWSVPRFTNCDVSDFTYTILVGRNPGLFISTGVMYWANNTTSSGPSSSSCVLFVLFDSSREDTSAAWFLSLLFVLHKNKIWINRRSTWVVVQSHREGWGPVLGHHGLFGVWIFAPENLILGRRWAITTARHSKCVVW